jgi:hypothetical protein
VTTARPDVDEAVSKQDFNPISAVADVCHPTNRPSMSDIDAHQHGQGKAKAEATPLVHGVELSFEFE